jgi:hypothetical protein
MAQSSFEVGVGGAFAGQRFYLIMILADIALLSGVILFAEELRALIGI